MIKSISALAVALLASAGAVTLATAAAAPPTSAAGSVTVPIAQQSNSAQTGTATLTSTSDGKTQVMIALNGEPNGASEPAHIHVGTCKNLNPKPAYPLNDIVAGKSTTVVNVPLATLQSSPFAINAHQSTTNLGTYVACGNIPATTNGATTNGSMPSAGASATPSPMMSEQP